MRRKQAKLYTVLAINSEQCARILYGKKNNYNNSTHAKKKKMLNAPSYNTNMNGRVFNHGSVQAIRYLDFIPVKKKKKIELN